MWVSSVGCLQFSLYMEHPVLPGTSATLIQYLAALAMVDGIKRKPGFGDLALHLKWPNDIYAIDHSGKEPVKRKVGGVLINSSFASQAFSIILGKESSCQLNKEASASTSPTPRPPSASTTWSISSTFAEGRSPCPSSPWKKSWPVSWRGFVTCMSGSSATRLASLPFLTLTMQTGFTGNAALGAA